MLGHCISVLHFPPHFPSSYKELELPTSVTFHLLRNPAAFSHVLEDIGSTLVIEILVVTVQKVGCFLNVKLETSRSVIRNTPSDFTGRKNLREDAEQIFVLFYSTIEELYKVTKWVQGGNTVQH